MIWGALFVAWPLVVTAALMLFLGQRLTRRRRFAAASLVAGYLMLAITGWAASTMVKPIVDSVEPTSYAVLLAIVALATAFPFVVTLLAMFAVSRRFIVRSEFV